MFFFLLFPPSHVSQYSPSDRKSNQVELSSEVERELRDFVQESLKFLETAKNNITTGTTIQERPFSRISQLRAALKQLSAVSF
jgi:predicted transcriptional regulator